ncbi:hypothetical protein QU38_02170, partial [Staphylococcus aureus]
MDDAGAAHALELGPLDPVLGDEGDRLFGGHRMLGEEMRADPPPRAHGHCADGDRCMGFERHRDVPG